jgi:hypothetical protein
MKTVFLLLSCLICSYCAPAQLNVSCAPERLFSLREGLSKEAVADSIKSMYNIVSSNSYIQRAAETGRSANTAIKETVIYTIKAGACINGTNGKLQFEYVNNKLQKAYLQTIFARADYYDMLDSFNILRNMIKPGWEREKEFKQSADNLVSTGYDYSKAKQSKSKTEKISLQYISTKPGKGYGIYLLQLTWVNTGNSGFETIVY